MNTQPLTPQSAGITGPMNINAVITHLIEMTPSQRKQFAQVHMDDPMMLSAAKFVDNQVNKQAQSLAAQQTGAAPPPVNQQAVAQMAGSSLPEDSGIAQLPVENMPDEYAGGGIVGYVEGGVINSLGQKIDPKTGYPVPLYKGAVNAVKGYVDDFGNLVDDFRASPKYQNYREMVDNPYGYTGNSGPRPRNAQRTTPANPAPTKNDRTPRNKDNYKPEKNPAEAAPNEKKEIDQLREGRVESASPSASATSASFKESSYSPKSKSSLEEVFKRSMDSQGPVVDPYAAQRAEAGESRQAIARRALEGVKERESGIEALLSKKEERVAEREERLKGQEGINLNMSLINAGLSMMQSTGKGLAGIAEGAQKGVSQYSEGMRLSEAARQKIEDARDAHDDLRFNLKNMSSKEKQAAENSIEEAKIVTTLETISGLEKAYGISHNKAVALFGAEITERTAESNREYQAFEAAEGRKFTGSQTDKQIAAAAQQSAADRSARAGEAAAGRAQAERLAKMPDANQRFYASLSPTGNVREGYAYAMQQRGEGPMDKARLAQAEKFLENPLNQRSNPELWRQAQAVVASSFASAVNVPDSSMRNRP
jgi:hypothetical protein